MRLGRGPSWQISVDRWNQAYDRALWFRAAERIDAPAGGSVPGPLDIDPLPEPSTGGADPGGDGSGDELVEGWLAWWHALNGMPRWRPGDPADPAAGRVPGFGPTPWVFGPPDFAGLAAWPALQRVVAERWPEGDAWHSRRKGAGLLHLRREITRQQREPPVVRDVERQLRRRVPPFELELVLLPVRDEEIRPVGEAKY